MLIDSNILVYSINSSSPKHKKAQEFLQENLSELAVAHQNILKECTVISPDYRTHRIALELIKKHSLSGDLVFDAYLVATALGNGIDIIATDNTKDFRRFIELKTINPFV